MHCPLSFLRRLSVGMFALLVAGCSLTTLPDRPEELTYATLVFQVPEVEQLELANGIQLYLKRDPEIPLVSISAMIGSGELSMPRDKTGIGDLFSETWRTGGTAAYEASAIEERLDLIAADLGASVGPYTSNLSLSIRTTDLAEGLNYLAAFLRTPAFAREKLELARLKALERLRRQNDSPGGISRRLLLAALYPDHPLGDWPSPESLAAVTRDDLLRYHAAHFAPNNLWLAVSGDFDPQQLIAELTRAFGDWPRRELPERPIPPVNQAVSGSIQVAVKEIPQTTILLGDLGITKDHPDQYAVRVMNYILGGGGFNSRMMREIRSNRGLAYSAYSYFQVGRRLPGPFVAGTETKTESVLPAVRLIREIMADLRTRPVSEAELNLAKDSLINSFVFGFDNTHAVVSRKMNDDFFGYPEDYLENYRDRIAAVTLDDVKRVAETYIRFDRQRIILVGQDLDLEALQSLSLPVRKVKLD